MEILASMKRRQTVVGKMKHTVVDKNRYAIVSLKKKTFTVVCKYVYIYNSR